MADEVETMFAVRQVPWHGLGKVVQEAPDSEQALILAELNWAVEQRPIFQPTADGMVQVPGFFANTRVTDEKVLGVVGAKYKVLQNREAFGFMDGMLGDGVRYETAGSLLGGREVWMCAKMPEVFRLAGGDETETYVIVTNRHDGWAGIRALVTPIRVVCKNTLNLALRSAKRSWTCKHTGNINAKMDEAKQTLGLVRNYMAELMNTAEVLASIKLAENDWKAIVGKLVPVPEEAKNESTIQRAKERQEQLRQMVYADDLANYVERGRHVTGWAAVNAVADFVDHGEPVRKSERWEERRFEEVIGGSKLVDMAFEMLMDQVKKTTKKKASALA